MESQMRLQETIGLGVHIWMGSSGKKYRYSVHMFGTTFGASPESIRRAEQSDLLEHWTPPCNKMR
jgi:hypothetical protein